MKFTTRTATNLGLLTGISIVLTRVFGVVLPVGGFGTLRLSFGEIPIMLSGIAFGPAAGAATGVAADLVGFAINPHGGPYFPGFTLTAALTGLLPGLLLYRKRQNLTWWQIALAIVITDMVTGILLNTLWLTFMYGTDFFVILLPRLYSRILVYPVYTIAIFLVNRAHQSYQESHL